MTAGPQRIKLFTDLGGPDMPEDDETTVRKAGAGLVQGYVPIAPPSGKAPPATRLPCRRDGTMRR